MMEFFGGNLSNEELEFIGLRIDPVHRAQVADEMRSRWFDYWELHPVKATYLYAHLYKQQTHTFAERYVDLITADEARAFTPDDIFRSRDMTGMWLARACCDRICVPYGFALTFAAKRAFDRTFHRMPRPNQLYGEDFELDLLDHWNATKKTSLQRSRLPQFEMASQWGILRQEPPPAVQAHTRYVLDQVLARPWPRHQLLGRLINEDVLHPTWLSKDFTREEIALAIQAAAALSG